MALSCLLPGFTGTAIPPWLASALADGLAGVVLFGSNIVDGAQVRSLTAALCDVAGRRLVIATDEEGGDVTRLDAATGSAVPSAAALGWLDDPAVTHACSAYTAQRLRDLGISLNLAPVADVNVDPQNPVIGVRSFGDNPDVVARHVAAAVRGTQSAGVAACLKHFPGHGATHDDSHHAVARLDRTFDEIREVELVPFSAGIAAGARAVMTGHLVASALEHDRLATVSPIVTTDLLRGALGFDGTIVTDALEMRAVADTIGMLDGFVQALAAGADLVETGALDYPELIAAIPQAVEQALRDGRLTAARLEDASERSVRLAAAAPENATVPLELAQVAARCLEISGEVPADLRRALVVECRTPNGMATGELPWSLAERLAGRAPDAAVVNLDGPFAIDDIARAAAGRPVIAIVRDPQRHEWQRPLVEFVRTRTDAVLVDVGWPAGPPGAAAEIRTRGVAPALLDAAASVLLPGHERATA